MRPTLVTALVLFAGVAHADSDDLVSRRLGLDAGHFIAQLTLEIGLQYAGGRPTSLAPDVWVGITDRLTIGIIHSDESVDQVDSGASFCVRQEPLTCPRTYRGSGLDVRYSVMSGPLAVAPRLRLVERDLDPSKPALMLGAQLQWTRGRFAISSDPYLRLGLANRDLGNRAAIMLPVWLALQPTCRWELALRTGFTSDLAVIRDGYHIPLALDVRARATSELDVAVEGGFTSLLGPQNNVSQAVISASLAWRH